jgi:uncharacterized protein (TIGR02246 family)
LNNPYLRKGANRVYFVGEELMPRHTMLFSLTFLLISGPLALAADTADRKSVDRAIHQTIAAMQDSYNRGDTKSLAACWTSDGEFVGPNGERIVGREKIEAAFQEFLKKHPNTKLQLGIAAWHPVTDDVAMADLLSQMTPVPEGVESEPVSNAVFVQRDGHWLIGSMHEMAGNEPGYRLHLKKLQWLVGEWAEDGGEASTALTHSACDWNVSGSYLIRRFSIHRKTGEMLDGTEVIGWDPREHRIRSWTFNSDGSFGESTWTREGDRWNIAHTGTLPKGGDLSVTYVVTPVDADTITVASKDRRVNGQPQPALPEVKLKRLSAKIAPKTPAIEPPKKVLP